MPLPRYVFTLNNKPMSSLEGEGRRYAAFSGTGSDINNLHATGHKDSGPLPVGRYYIVDRESGGRLGGLRDWLHNQGSGSINTDWFALYRDDGTIDDWTFVNQVKRGAFRLHPAGVRRVSRGCITFSSQMEFYQLRNRLRNTSIYSTIPSTGTRYYGIVDVIPNPALTQMPSTARKGGR